VSALDPTSYRLSCLRVAVALLVMSGLSTLAACEDSAAPERSKARPDPTLDARSGAPDSQSEPPPAASEVVYRASTQALTRAAKDSDAGTGLDLMPCDSLADCPEDDELFCNGIAACEAYRSRDGAIDSQGQTVCVVVQPCPSALVDSHGRLHRQLCDEARDSCDCNPGGLQDQIAWYCNPDAELPAGMLRTTDIDNDNVDYPEDCDDADPRRNPAALEICDPDGVDEDCNLETVEGQDVDGDGESAASCLNIDPATGARHVVAGFADCDDLDDGVSPKAVEICDDRDNDCDGQTDEDSDGNALGLRQEMCLDEDGDNYVLADAQAQRWCLGSAPQRLIPCPAPTGPFDCEDDPARCGVRCQPGIPETCDGFDNNCNGRSDEDEQQDIQSRPSFSDGTLAECRPVAAVGHTAWAIVDDSCPEGTQWCDQTTAYNGCEADIRTRRRCGACETDHTCTFACQWEGDDPGCDEVTQVEVGRETSCAITQRGQLACWGGGAEGQLGNGARARSTRPVLVSIGRVHKVSVGLRHVCAIAGEDRSVLCWGSDTRSQLTTENGEPVFELLGSLEAYQQGSDFPVEVNTGAANPRLTGVVDLSLGYWHACAVIAENRVICWGDFAKGKLGHGPWTYNQPDLVVDAADEPVTASAVSSGVDHACAIKPDGHVLCWGGNQSGQLGYPEDTLFGEGEYAGNYRTYAAEVPGIDRITDIAAGSFHTCAIDEERRVWCWGTNDFGELGRDAAEDSHVPKIVAGVPPVASLTAGTLNTCMLAETADGGVWCWGARSPGFMGQPLDGNQTAPVEIETEQAKQISASETLCVLSKSDVVSCRGVNDYGQLGDGSLPTQSPVVMPVLVQPLTD
jgi:alpha-tubulin suppressor-like RCC1 family protein